MQGPTMRPSLRLQREAVKMLVDLKGQFKVSERAVQCVVDGTDRLFEVFLDFLKDKISNDFAMLDGNIAIDRIHESIETLRGQSFFQGVDKSKLLDSYVQTHSSKEAVKLKKLVFERKWVWRHGIPKKIDLHFGYFIPFKSQLEQLLNCKDVWDCVKNPLPPKEGVIQNVTDGSFYKDHPVAQRVLKENNGVVLIIVIYVDDVEPCDPLKSKTGKHTLRLFYWTLYNIHPDRRSSLKAINLLAIVKKRVAKQFGNEHFLKDFMDAVKTLGEEGLVFNIQGEEVRVHGILLCACGDNPALANLGGFKEGHFAFRPCRFCLVKRSDLCANFTELEHLMRNKTQHEQFLREVLASVSDENAEVVDVCEEDNSEEEDEEEQMEVDESEEGQEFADHPDPSVNYGINGASVLSDAPGFDLTRCLSIDLLHMMAEGVVEVTCRLILKDVCLARNPNNPKRPAKNRLKLDYINDVIENLSDFGHFNKNKPSIIEKSHLNKKLRQSGAQMLLLLHVLPFILLSRCPVNKIQILVKLQQLLNLCMSFEQTTSEADDIKARAEEFGRSFKAIYPNINTPKLHFLSHLYSQLKCLGPLRQLACFRYEAMHSEFTSIVPVVRTKKDIALSCGKRYLQKRNAAIMQGKDDGTFLYSGDDIHKPVAMNMMDLPEKDCLLEFLPHCSEDDVVIKTRKVTRYGMTWESGVVIQLKDSHFGSIKSVFIVDSEIVFTYIELQTSYAPLLNAHEVTNHRTDLKCVLLKDLVKPYPVAKFKFVYQREIKIFLITMSTGNN